MQSLNINLFKILGRTITSKRNMWRRRHWTIAYFTKSNEILSWRKCVFIQDMVTLSQLDEKQLRFIFNEFGQAIGKCWKSSRQDTGLRLWPWRWDDYVHKISEFLTHSMVFFGKLDRVEHFIAMLLLRVISGLKMQCNKLFTYNPDWDGMGILAFDFDSSLTSTQQRTLCFKSEQMHTLWSIFEQTNWYFVIFFQ